MFGYKALFLIDLSFWRNAVTEECYILALGVARHHIVIWKDQKTLLWATVLCICGEEKSQTWWIKGEVTNIGKVLSESEYFKALKWLELGELFCMKLKTEMCLCLSEMWQLWSVDCEVVLWFWSVKRWGLIRSVNLSWWLLAQTERGWSDRRCGTHLTGGTKSSWIIHGITLQSRFADDKV